MADDKQPQKLDQSSAQSSKQDTKEEITKKVKELREHIDEQLEGDDVDPMLIERTNQIFNDAIAAIPPDPQEPKFQRATITTTLTKIKQQMEGALQSVNAKEEVTKRFKAPLETAEKQAKEEDQKKGTAQPAGPSQSAEQTRLNEQADQGQRPTPQP